METKYANCLKYIDRYWDKLTFYCPKDKGIYIGMPHKFIAPSSAKGIYKQDQFYWDSYFIILGLVECGKTPLAKGMVENFAYLQKRFGIVPHRNRFYNTGISQPPFLSSMVREIFERTGDKAWLKKMASTIESELAGYWMNDKNLEKHLIFSGLSRYCDDHLVHVTAENESGWDTTSRFGDQCMDYLPVDLNSLLYKYEKDLEDIFVILGDKHKAKWYSMKARKRKDCVIKLMWNEKKGFFFDYNYKTGEQGDFYSLAGYYPLWAGLAEPEQAKKCRDNLKRFEYDGGLANTQKSGLSKEFRQWDYPNGWANQQWIVIKGLSNYGFADDARRLAVKWVDLNAKVFSETKKFWEKYNVVEGGIGKEERYPIQTGFGWTNAVFVKLINEFDIH